MAKERTVSNLYHKVYKELVKNLRQISEPYEFNRGELPVLAKLIKRGDGITQKEILDDIPITKSTMSKIISSLVQKGYLEKRKDPDDRRATKIYLTEKGRKAGNKIKEIDRKVEKIMLKGFTENEKEDLTVYLRELLKNLKNA